MIKEMCLFDVTVLLRLVTQMDTVIDNYCTRFSHQKAKKWMLICVLCILSKYNTIIMCRFEFLFYLVCSRYISSLMNNS